MAKPRRQNPSFSGSAVTRSHRPRLPAMPASSSQSRPRPTWSWSRMLFANWTQSEAEQVAANYLGWTQRKGIRPAGIWAGNDPSGARRTQGRRGRRHHTGPEYPGGRPQLVGGRAARNQGRSSAADRWRPFLLGGWSIVLLRDYADGCDCAASFAAHRSQDVGDHARQSCLRRCADQDPGLRPDRFCAVQGKAGTLRPIRLLGGRADLVPVAPKRRR